MNQVQLKELYDYNPDTGIFTRKQRPRSSFKNNYGYIGHLSVIERNKLGTISQGGYLLIEIGKKKYRAHRLAWLYVHGRFPVDQIDHINHLRADNRIINLREATNQENSKNISLRKDNVSGITGVYFRKEMKKWGAFINHNTKRIHLGFFKDFFEAVSVRKSAENKYGFHQNHGMS